MQTTSFSRMVLWMVETQLDRAKTPLVKKKYIYIYIYKYKRDWQKWCPRLDLNLWRKTIWWERNLFYGCKWYIITCNWNKMNGVELQFLKINMIRVAWFNGGVGSHAPDGEQGCVNLLRVIDWTRHAHTCCCSIYIVQDKFVMEIT